MPPSRLVKLAVLALTAVEQVPSLGVVCLWYQLPVWPLIVKVAVVWVMALAVRTDSLSVSMAVTVPAVLL